MFRKVIGACATAAVLSLVSLSRAQAFDVLEFTTTLSQTSSPGYNPGVFGVIPSMTFPGEQFGWFYQGPDETPPSFSTAWQTVGGGAFDIAAATPTSSTTTVFTFNSPSATGFAYPTNAIWDGVHADDPANPFNVATDELALAVNPSLSVTTVYDDVQAALTTIGLTEDQLISDLIYAYQFPTTYADCGYCSSAAYANDEAEGDVQYFNTVVGPEISFAFPGQYKVYYFSAGSLAGGGYAGPAPEPGAWAMLLLGLFGVGSALRRRRRPRAMEGA
jgi:hypothetical protein